MVDLERLKWEGPEPLAPGQHNVEFDFVYPGKGAGTLAFNNFSGVNDADYRPLRRLDHPPAFCPARSGPGQRWRAAPGPGVGAASDRGRSHGAGAGAVRLPRQQQRPARLGPAGGGTQAPPGGAGEGSQLVAPF